MKKIKIILVFLFLSFITFAQKDFNRSIISNNSILKCSEYQVIPKNNPDYYKKPVGLMLKAEFFFDINGNVIKYFSPNGAVTSLSESKALKEYYIYKDNRIVKMYRVDFDSISVEYLYFKKRNLIFKIKINDKNERIGLELIYSNSSNEKELKKIEIDFHNSTDENHYANIYNSNLTYYKRIKKSKTSRKLFSISKEQLNLFKTSIEIEKIENELSVIEKNNALDVVNFETSFIYNNQKQLIKEVSESNTIEYVYNKKGLLISCIDKNKKYSFKSKFIYSER
jgi:YD repeat-containing protein